MGHGPVREACDKDNCVRRGVCCVRGLLRGVLQRHTLPVVL
jgi:hypothetical protein